MDALNILKSARAKIANPEDWGKGRRGLDRPRETYCAAEAIETTSHSAERMRAYRALSCAAGTDIDLNITEWNDAPERTHAEVIAAFNLAIATLRM
jgi:hypothetical protein